MTPQQMRALAERLSQMAESRAMDFDETHVAMTLDDSAAALRAAADQLEAVQSFQDDVNTIADWLDLEGYGVWVQTDELARLLVHRYPIIGLTAETAPQEDRNE